jgi:hypothetical protein
MIEATVDVGPSSLGGQLGDDAEVASKRQRGAIGLWKHELVVFGSENPKARKRKGRKGRK